jgi:ferredoxin-NADP reductase
VYLIDYSNWLPEHLQAYAVIATMLLIVLAMIFVFRELGSKAPTVAGPTADGRFGFRRSRGEKVTMKVLQVRQLSPDVKSFRLQPLEGYADYEAGQFLTFHLGDNNDIPRCYSLNTSPTRPGIYEVSVKRLEGGLGSGWMHDKVAVGDILTVSNPSGHFTLHNQGRETVLVAGGIGVTPMVSMLTRLIDEASDRKITFFYGARQERDLVFRDEIEALVSRSPNASFIPVLSQADDDWNGLKGYLSAEILLGAGIDFSQAELYTCGPPVMMTLARDLAMENGMPREFFFNEVFASPASAQMDPRQATITVDGRTLQYDGAMPLLNFLEANEVPVPSSCRAGVCGTCEVIVAAGEVETLDSDYLSDADRAAGRCLSCISYPKTDLTVDV